MSVENKAGQDVVVDVCNLGRSFKRKRALDGASLQVGRGQVFGLVGANGAGKTTLIKHVLGVLKAKQGSVRVFGQDPVRNQVATLSRIGYLSEDRDLPGWMTVEELMHYTQAFYPAWDEDYAEALRAHFELDPKAKIRQLSRGEKAKAGLLAALAYRPELLLLDEPSSGLDVSSRQDILGAIVRTVADEGRTVLFSSHLLDEVERVADHICMVHEGRVILDGPLDELRSGYQRRVVNFDEAVTAQDLGEGVVFAEGKGREWTVIVKAGTPAPAAACRILEASQPTLEQLFLAFTRKPKHERVAL